MEYFRYPDLVNYLLKSTQNGSETGTNPMQQQQVANHSKGMHDAFGTSSSSQYDYKPKNNLLIRSKSSSGNARKNLRSFGVNSQAGSIRPSQGQTPSQTQSVYSKQSKRSVFNPPNAPSTISSKRRERFNENMDNKSVRSLARSTRSLTSANLLNRATSANGSQQDRKSVSYVSTASKFN